MLHRSGLAMAVLLLSGGAAVASPFSITTTGTITAGSDSGNLLGAGTSLAGDHYVLTLNFTGIGPNYYTDGTGQFAQDLGDAIVGSVSVTIGQHTTTTTVTANIASSLIADTSDLNANLSGNDAAGEFAAGAQSISGSTVIAPFADLQTGFSAALGAGTSGIDTYSFSNAANTSTASFTGAATSVQLAVPEPSTWTVLGAALLGLGLIRRRTAALAKTK